ncbi:MAG: hypothetical protein ACRYFK_16675 [Janthinobacterium lividum]
MKVEIKVLYELVNGGTGGSQYRGTGLAFDTDKKVIEDYTVDRFVALLDPKPANVELPAGQILWYECAADYTQTSWVYSGGRSFTVAIEANSATCGWTPPKTCDLGTAEVAQQVMASGVRLTVRYSGTANGVVQYALDGGTEQTSPVFAAVASGQHQVQVRDGGLDGCARTVSVYVAPVATGGVALPAAPSGPPAGIDFVAQPLFYSLSGQPANALVEVELWAESAHGLGDFAQVFTLRKRVSTLGAVSFRLDTLLRPLLSAFVPPAGVASVDQVSAVCVSNLANYYLRTTTTPPAAGAAPSYAVSALRTALRGGLPAEWQDTDYFARRLGDEFGAPPFLSWQPTGPGAYAQSRSKAVVANQPEWLFFLVDAAQHAAQLRVRRAYGGDAVDYEPLVQPAGGWTNRLLAIPLKDSRAGYDTLRVRVETSTGQVLSQEAVYRFVPASERTRFVLFANSLGGLDTLRCEWVLSYALEATADAVELPRLRTPAYGQAPLAESRVGDLLAGRKLKLATGVLTPAELLWAQELVLSRDIWQQVATQLRPLDWPKRSLTPYADEFGPRGLLLEFDYAYAVNAYAPLAYQ